MLHQCAIEHGPPGAAAGFRPEFVAYPALRIENSLGALRARILAAQGRKETRVHRACAGGGLEPAGGTGLKDHRLKQRVGIRRTHEREDAHGPGRLAEEGHSGRIAPEGLDVVPDPAQCHELITQTEIARVGIVEIVQPAEGPEAVVQRHQDNIAPCDQAFSAMDRVGGLTIGEAAAVDPHHDRPKPEEAWGHDIQAQAVFRDCGDRPRAECRTRSLERTGPRLSGQQGRGLGCRRRWRSKPQAIYGRRRKRNAVKANHAAACVPLHGTVCAAGEVRAGHSVTRSRLRPQQAPAAANQRGRPGRFPAHARGIRPSPAAHSGME